MFRLGLGVFDGLHKGHRDIVSQCDALLTFAPHPDVVLKKRTALKRLTTLDELRALSPIPIYTCRFSKKVAVMSPQLFLDTLILPRFKPTRIVVGYDFRFGAKKAGDAEFLRQWGKAHNIDVVVVPATCDDFGKPIKSEMIRDALVHGRYEEALMNLTHPYVIKGRVVEGDKRGRLLGFPTANLEVPADKLLPKPGVFAGSVRVGKHVYKAMIYIGHKPTFGGKKTVVEAFLIDFEGDLYHKPLTVFVQHFIRGEKRFEGKNALVKQLNEDLDTTKKIMKI
jgi:riboflavin kinase/FMN adenylyltransferase